jgi:hypothetical protein
VKQDHGGGKRKTQVSQPTRKLRATREGACVIFVTKDEKSACVRHPPDVLCALHDALAPVQILPPEWRTPRDVRREPVKEVAHRRDLSMPLD